MAFYTEVELEALGFKSLGKNVKLSKLASIYGASKISIGDNSRIDDFCVLSAGEGGIKIGKHVHIGVYVSIIGAGKVILEDFTGISGRCSLYSSNDDYLGVYMTNPTIPAEFTNVKHGPITVRKHSVIGTGSVILPNVVIGECSAIGNLSVVNETLEAGYIYVGNPIKKVMKRRRGCFKLENEFLNCILKN